MLIMKNMKIYEDIGIQMIMNKDLCRKFDKIKQKHSRPVSKFVSGPYKLYKIIQNKDFRCCIMNTY